jgi:lipocalin
MAVLTKPWVRRARARPSSEGDYWVIQRADDGRYAVVSEPSRRFLWVLSRSPQLSSADETAIRSRLLEQGFELGAWAAHPHGEASARASSAQLTPGAAPAPASKL